MNPNHDKLGRFAAGGRGRTSPRQTHSRLDRLSKLVHGIGELFVTSPVHQKYLNQRNLGAGIYIKGDKLD